MLPLILAASKYSFQHALSSCDVNLYDAVRRELLNKCGRFLPQVLFVWLWDLLDRIMNRKLFYAYDVSWAYITAEDEAMAKASRIVRSTPIAIKIRNTCGKNKLHVGTIRGEVYSFPFTYRMKLCRGLTSTAKCHE